MTEIMGWTALGIAGLIGVTNFYRSFLRYGIHRVLGWEYRWESGIPAVGTLLVVVALACLWRERSAWYLASTIALFDTAGLPWFALVMAREAIKSQGDPPASGINR